MAPLESYPMAKREGQRFLLAGREGIAAVANGQKLRAFPTFQKEFNEPIAGLALTGAGAVVCAAGKELRMWKQEGADWNETSAAKVPKRVTSMAGTRWGAVVGTASGDVVTLKEGKGETEMLLAHTACPITSVAIGEGRVATGDEEGRARVSRLPRELAQGAHVIDSFCLGHEGAIVAMTWLAGHLLTSAKDASLRLWHPSTGCEVSSMSAEAPAISMVQLSQEAAVVALRDVPKCLHLQASSEGKQLRRVEGIEMAAIPACLSSFVDGIAYGCSVDGGMVWRFSLEEGGGLRVTDESDNLPHFP